MSARIVLADDDASLRFILQQALSKEGYTVRATSNVATLSKWVCAGEADLVLSDVYMGDACVFDELPRMRQARPNVPIIVMSAQSTVATALSANTAGAFDYVPKPFDLDQLLDLVRRALSHEPDAKTRAQNAKAEKEEPLAVIGRSPAMQDVYRTMARVAATDLTVLIEGESGTGKERVARALHAYSRRAKAPFATLSLAGAAPLQIESDLFGSAGKLSEAHHGSLFLEDIDELPLAAQTRLAGLMSAADKRLDVRLIVSAQRSLAGLVAEGLFRQDLFHHLNVVRIHLPPLRQRPDDIPDLARAFLIRARKEGLSAKSIDNSAIDRLKAYAFPGNIRELENVLRRAITLTPGSLITADALVGELAVVSRQSESAAETNLSAAVLSHVEREFLSAAPSAPEPGLYQRALAELERPLIARTLKETRGNQIRAAAILGLNRNTLRKKIQSLGIPTGAGD
jgi:two-component system nitrogen regulation response regulator GlnG